MLLIFAGGHRMGSTYQSLIGRHAMAQLGIHCRMPANPELNVFHLQRIRKVFKICDSHPGVYFFAKPHAAFPAQVEAVMTAQQSRIFLVWRDQRDSLVSDFHYAQRKAGHVYADFDDYFWRRGRKILLRNCLQKVVWDGVVDPRVRAWQYLDLTDNFKQSADEMLRFAGLNGVDLDALADSVSIKQLRHKYNDPEGTFFRKGGKQNLESLKPNAATLESIGEIERERDWRRLGRAYEREDWMRVMIFGRESKDAGWRKSMHWWAVKTRRMQRLQSRLSRLYRFSPRRLAGAIGTFRNPGDA